MTERGSNRAGRHAAKAEHASAGATRIADRDALRRARARKRPRRARIACAGSGRPVAQRDRPRARPHVERAVSNGGHACAARIHRAADGDRYTLTLKLFELAHRHKPIKSLTAAAAPLMLELVHRALQSCHLTVFHAGRVMVVGEVDSPERYAFGMKVGALVGLTDTASGYVLLAFQDDNTRSACSRRTGRWRASSTSNPRSSRKSFAMSREGLRQVQSRQTRGVTNIAFPISGPTGHAVAVLNVPYIERIDKKVTPSIEAVKELLRESAAHCRF